MAIQLDRRALLASVTSLALLPLVGAGRASAQGAPPRPTPTQFAKTSKVEHIALSPDAAHFAYVTAEGGTRVLVIIDLKGGSAQKVPMGDYKLRGLFWGSPTHIIFKTSTTLAVRVGWRTREHFQAHVFNIVTGKVYTLFEKMNDFLNVTYGGEQVLRRNGKYSLLSMNLMESTGEMTLFEFDLDRNKSVIVDGGREGTVEWLLKPDGTPAARASIDFKQATKRFWFLERLVDGKWQEIYRKEVLTEMPSLEGFSKDGNSFIVFLNEEGEGGLYYEMDAQGKVSPPLFGRDGTKSPLYHPITRRLAGYSEEGDWDTYHYDDPILAGVVAAGLEMIEPGERLKIEDQADDPRKVILYTEGPNNAGGYFYADFTTGDVIPILQSHPDIAPEWVSDKTAIRYKAADGLEISAYLTLPPFKPAKDLPLVVLVHGGPTARDTLAFEWEAQAYASQGYAVLQPNYRGSTGYGWDFMAAGFGEYGRKMQTDLSDGVRHLVKQGVVDAKRVAIAGASYGGYAALAGATIDRGVYRCAVDVAGVSDPDFFYLNTNLRENSGYRWAKRLLGDGDLTQISPLKNADKADIPILVIHGEDDTVVSIEESNRMVAALERAGKNVTYIKLKKEDHWQSTEPGRIEMINTIIPFLQKHNPA